MRIKTLFFALTFISISIHSRAQCPDQNIFLINQDQVDSFKIKYPFCTEINHGLYIGDFSELNKDIIDLSGLNNLNSIEELYISNCTVLEEVYISDDLRINSLSISNCLTLNRLPILNNLSTDGTISLSSLPQLDETQNFDLDSISGFSLRYMELESLNLFSQLKYCSGFINLYMNEELSDIFAINHLRPNQIIIRGNSKLSQCNIDPVCNLLATNEISLDIRENGPNCEDILDIVLTCFPESEECFLEEILINSQNDLEKLGELPDHCIDSIRVVDIWTSSPDHITDLSEMNRFKTLEDLIIRSNPQLVNLKGLDSLSSVDNFEIRHNPILESIEGLGSLERVSTFNIIGNEMLRDLSSEHAQLNEVDLLTVHSSPSTSLSAFSGIESLSSLTIFQTEMTLMDWMHPALKVDEVVIRQNPLLNQITSNPETLLFGSTEIIDNEQLQTIQGIGFIDTVQNISITGNPIETLENIQGPDVLNGTMRLANLQVETLSPWNNLKEGNQIFVYENSKLKNFEFLESFDQIHRLNIQDNPSLLSLGQNSITTQRINYFVLTGNEQLSDIQILDYNLILNNIFIRDNPMLSSCEILPICREYKSVEPNIFLESNGGNCNLVDLNFDCDWGNNAYGDVVVRSQEDIDSIQSFFPEMDSVFGNLIIDFSLNLAGADYSFFDNIGFVRDVLEIRVPKAPGMFELFEGTKVGGLLLVGMEISSLDLLEYQDTLDRFRLTDVDGITDFRALENVKLIRNKIDIVETPIFSADGLENLESIWDIQFVDCPNLENIDALSNANQIANLRLAVLPNLSNLDAFEGMIFPRRLHFTELPLIDKIPPFEPRNFCEEINISRCHAIEEVHLDSLETAFSRLHFFNNDNLKSVSFDRLDDVTSLSLSFNQSLENISFPSLMTLDGILRIRENPSLISLNGINSGAIAVNFTLENNENLEDCNPRTDLQ